MNVARSELENTELRRHCSKGPITPFRASCALVSVACGLFGNSGHGGQTLFQTSSRILPLLLRQMPMSEASILTEASSSGSHLVPRSSLPQRQALTASIRVLLPLPLLPVIATTPLSGRETSISLCPMKLRSAMRRTVITSNLLVVPHYPDTSANLWTKLRTGCHKLFGPCPNPFGGTGQPNRE